MLTTSKVALGALVEKESILQVARSGNFLGTAIWPWRIAFIVGVDFLAFVLAINMRTPGMGVIGSPFPHGASYVALHASKSSSI